MTEKDRNIVVAERERFEQYMFKKFGYTGSLKNKVERFRFIQEHVGKLTQKEKDKFPNLIFGICRTNQKSI